MRVRIRRFVSAHYGALKDMWWFLWNCQSLEERREERWIKRAKQIGATHLLIVYDLSMDVVHPRYVMSRESIEVDRRKINEQSPGKKYVQRVVTITPDNNKHR